MFSTVVDAVFWATALLQHKYEGGHIQAGASINQKSFEPIDIMVPLWRMIRKGTLTKTHEKIVMSYGVGGYEPSENSQDYKIWTEAMCALKPIFIIKKIISNV